MKMNENAEIGKKNCEQAIYNIVVYLFQQLYNFSLNGGLLKFIFQRE